MAVTTIEKASSTVSRLAEEGRLDELCCVVVDELHMVGDPDRGAALESLLAKLRYAARKKGEAEGRRRSSSWNNPSSWTEAGRRREGTADNRGEQGLQIVAMSATVSHPTLERLAGWLDARLFCTNFRPVPLQEHVVCDGAVYRKGFGSSQQAGGSAAAGKENAHPLNPPHPQGGPGNSNSTAGGERDIPRGLVHERDIPRSANDRDGTLALVEEAVSCGHSCLVFCQSREQCRVQAKALAEEGLSHQPPGYGACTPTPRELLVAELTSAAEGAPDAELVGMISRGVAYHHAGLSGSERAVIERGFRSGALKALTATTTLAAGVNLPARRVVIRHALTGRAALLAAQYRQMAGRAGRTGQTDAGEAFLIASSSSGGPDKALTLAVWQA